MKFNRLCIVVFFLSQLLFNPALQAQKVSSVPYDTPHQQRTNPVNDTVAKSTKVSFGIVPGLGSGSFTDNKSEPLFFPKNEIVGRAWNITGQSSGVPEGAVSIEIPSANISSILPVTEFWLGAGDFVDQVWFGASLNNLNSGLYAIDPFTGQSDLIASTGKGILGLAYDEAGKVMYASVWDGQNSNLYTVDLRFGELEFIGIITDNIIIGIAIDNDGNLFALDLNDNQLLMVDRFTAQSTVIGPLGVSVNNMQDIGYDRQNDILYGTLMTEAEIGGLYTIDTQTGQATLLNNFYAQLGALAIPYVFVEDDAPGSVTDFLITPDSNGELSATISWVNPSSTFNGEVLEQLNQLVILRGNEIIFSLADPGIGQAESVIDNGIEQSGNYIYRMFGVNDAGEGFVSSTRVYIGEDIPGNPLNVNLQPLGNHALVSWDDPVEGLNQGFFDGQNLSYSLHRLPGNILVAESITGNSFTDTQLPNTNVYQYIVTAINHIGPGGNTLSNKEILGNENVLFAENFNYPPGNIPGNWQIVGNMQDNWYLWPTSNAGGDVPEIMFSWAPDGAGISRLVSPAIQLNGFDHIRVQFKHKLVDYFSDLSPYVVGVDVSYDNGSTWSELRQFPAWNILARTEQIYIEVPENANSIHIAFRFQGNSLGVEQWFIDDVVVEPVFENHIEPVSIMPADLIRDFVPVANQPSSFAVTMQNKGSLPQSDYTVKLVDRSGVVVAQVAGVPLEMGQTHTYLMSFTPSASQVGEHVFRVLADIPDIVNPGNNSLENLKVTIMPQTIQKVSIGQDNDLFSPAIPFVFYAYASLSQTIYPASDIGINGGYISGISFTSNFFDNVPGREIKVYLGETTQFSISNQYIPTSELKLVFNGRLDFPAGINNIFIPFDEPYLYQGGNIVIFTNRVLESIYFRVANFFYNNAGTVGQTRISLSGGQPLHPESPPAFGSNESVYPSISFYFDKQGRGAMAGNVNDGQFGIQGVKVELVGTHHSVLTNHIGNYQFPFVLEEGNYTVRFSKPGYTTLVLENVAIEEAQTTQLNASLTALELFSLQGVVKDGLNNPIDGAWIKLTGVNDVDYKWLSDQNGTFASSAVYEGAYLLEIVKYGFEPYVNEQFVLDQDTDLGVIELEKILYEPSQLVVDVIGQEQGNALFSWRFEQERSFRYDDGVLNNTFGFVFGGLSTVIGSVFPNDSRVQKIAWFNNVGSGSGTAVNIWVLGLDENGLPDAQNILYEAANVSNVNNSWNIYHLPHEVEAPNGFFIGLSYAGNIGLGMDSGQNAQWPFQANTHFYTPDIYNGVFHSIESQQSNAGNLLLRAYGWDAGPIEAASVKDAETIAHLGFNVFINDLEIPVVENISANEFQFTALTDGLQTAGVQAVYSIGNSPVVTEDFANFGNVVVTITMEANSGDPLEGAIVTLTNENFAQFTYEQLSPPSGTVVFEAVSRGTYTLEVLFDNHQPYLSSGLDIQDDLVYDLTLVEIIEEPFGLLVDTRNVASGEALLRWNIFEEGFFEGFENAFPPNGWEQINPDGGSGWTQLATGTTPLPGWNGGEAFPAPNGGDFMAFSTYLQSGSNFNDMWLVSPQVFVVDDFELSFFLRYYPNSFNDNFQIALSTTSATDPSAFDIIVDVIRLSFSSSTQWKQYVYDLSEFVPLGTPVYIGFREFVDNNASEGAALMLDNIRYGFATERYLSPFVSDFSSGDVSTQREHSNLPLASSSRSFLGYNIHLNDSLVAQNVSGNQFLFSELPTGIYTAGVQSVYTSGMSQMVTAQFEITDGFVAPEFASVQFINLIPASQNTPLSVYLEGDPVLDGLPFLQTSAYIPVEVGVNATLGFDVANTIIGTFEFPFLANSNYMLAVVENISGASQNEPELQFILVENARTQAVNPSNVDMIFLNAFPASAALEFWHSGAGVMISQVAQGMHSSYASLPANDFIIDLKHQNEVLGAFYASLSSLGYQGKAIGVIASNLQTDDNTDMLPNLWVALPDEGLLHPLERMITNQVGTPGNESSVLVYPNPASGLVSIKSDMYVELLNVHDLGGRKVFSVAPESIDFTVDLSGLEPGVYLIMLKGKDFIGFERLIISR